MSKVFKRDGKFFLEPDPVILARAARTGDAEKLKSNMTDVELRALLERILARLAALER